MKVSFILLLGIFFGTLLIVSYSVQGQEDYAVGLAVIQGTSPDSAITGKVNLKETDEGLKIDVKVENVPNPGKHGFHIHQFGSCDDKGDAAGGHYNPTGVKHGFLPHGGLETAHAGDMGNITINEEGKGELSVVLPEVSLTNGIYNIAGRAIVLHEKEDDFGQPTGNAGGRIGCGTITIVKD